MYVFISDEKQIFLKFKSFQGSPYHNPDSPVQTQNDLSYEDQIANQILTEFPEITNVLGQILDENSQ